MKIVLQFILFIAGCSNINPLSKHKHVDISDPTNSLTGKQEIIQLNYVA
jgi:hypothetical protein